MRSAASGRANERAFADMRESAWRSPAGAPPPCASRSPFSSASENHHRRAALHEIRGVVLLVIVRRVRIRHQDRGQAADGDLGQRHRARRGSPPGRRPRTPCASCAGTAAPSPAAPAFDRPRPSPTRSRRGRSAAGTARPRGPSAGAWHVERRLVDARGAAGCRRTRTPSAGPASSSNSRSAVSRSPRQDVRANGIARHLEVVAAREVRARLEERQVHLVGDARRACGSRCPGTLFCSCRMSGRPSSRAASATGALT